ncbi:LuxR C-terminal-related transcriptional regulator [uncultured Roseibium sp.]|uniref:helix-turn-helix transcriptional regulator n=1 Tax=uncultured Roseibium sp. TaxID=1936171 RepID=UPI0026291C09|nr:LuxR C-terminal-related transcriptional regulator [uncultured Roseibium sp.]
MYFGSRHFGEDITYGGFLKDRRTHEKLDFPYMLARRFEYLVFSVFVFDSLRNSVEAQFTTDDPGRLWDASFLIEQEKQTLAALKRDICAPVYHDAVVLRCIQENGSEDPAKSVLETDRAATLSVDLGSGLQLFLTAHIPCGFSEQLFQGVVAYMGDIFGGFRSYAEELVFGFNRIDLKSSDYWIKHIKHAALVVYGNGYLLTKNSAAEALLQSGEDLRIVDGRILGPADLLARFYPAKSIDALAVQGLSQSSPSTQRHILHTASGTQLLLEPVPSFSDEDKQDDPVRNYFTKKILVASTDGPINADPLLIKATAGVTLQQARLIQQLIAGKSVRQAAEEIGIRYNTARNHIAMAQQRLEVSSQAELINVVQRAISIAPELEIKQ